MTKRNSMLAVSLFVIAAVIVGCVQEAIDVDTTLNILENENLITYDQSEVIDGAYIIIFNDEALPTKRANVNKANYVAKQQEMADFAKKVISDKRLSERPIKHSYAKTISGVAMDLTKDEVQVLLNDDRISFIEQDQTFHVTMGGPPGGNGGSVAQTTPWGVTRVGGAKNGTKAGRAWIIDSGIDMDHPDLNVDVAKSKSFLSGGQSSNPNDQNGHGTHVAGTVAAIDNSIGVIGVAAGASVVSVRVLDRRGSGANSGVIAGVDYVGANAASGDAANMSLGGGVSTALDNAVKAAASACPFVLAAGNESQHANNLSPARANGNNIYTVSSMTSNNSWSSFSNYGNPPVDYCAPGSSINSTYKGGGYSTLSGTSMAAPHVCGILLIGGITSDGTVIGDPDGNHDRIAHH